MLTDGIKIEALLEVCGLKATLQTINESHDRELHLLNSLSKDMYPP